MAVMRSSALDRVVQRCRCKYIFTILDPLFRAVCTQLQHEEASSDMRCTGAGEVRLGEAGIYSDECILRTVLFPGCAARGLVPQMIVSITTSRDLHTPIHALLTSDIGNCAMSVLPDHGRRGKAEN